MAVTNTVAGKFFRCDDTLESISLELTRRMDSVALMTRMLRDLTVYGAVGTGSSEPDPEEIAALADGLLAYIGFIDPLIDKLDALANDARNQQAAA